jgi:hypothetical protein
MGNKYRYSVGTWDGDSQSYTPQIGLTVRMKITTGVCLLRERMDLASQRL